MDDEFKKLLDALSRAVNESLVHSTAFVNAVAELWRAGKDASMQAQLADADESVAANPETSDPPPTLTLTADDEHFLRLLRIASPV